MIGAERHIGFWLFTCAAAVFLMALIGAVTRLTESGLSIVEWKPVTGALPPLSAADWEHAFDLYKTSPQYRKVNFGMSLAEFRQIYFWEWLHRLWGRMIGVIYFVPLLYFWARRQIPDAAKKHLVAILALGFLQGALGWFMVRSGLIDQPAVSHYRLAAHLGLAALIFCALFRGGMVFSAPPEPLPRTLGNMVKATLALAAATMLCGAFVAGLRAGLIYNTFPLMGARLWPGEIFSLSPVWKNFFENHATVQFTHRVLAAATFCQVLFLAGKSLSFSCSARMRRLFIALGIAAVLQVALGITTVLTQVNIAAAVLHQAGAFVVLALLMALLHNAPQAGE